MSESRRSWRREMIYLANIYSFWLVDQPTQKQVAANDNKKRNPKMCGMEHHIEERMHKDSAAYEQNSSISLLGSGGKRRDT